MKRQVTSNSQYDPFGMNLEPIQTTNLLDGGDDDFGVFEKESQPMQKTIDFNASETDENKEKSIKLLRKEQNELFGLFPPKDKLESKYIMLVIEITRIH